MYFDYGEAELSYLRQKDKRLCAVIDRIGHIDRTVDTDLFSSVVHHIVGQQISTKAQATVWRRMQDALGEETPSLSGGEAQRLKLASEIGKSQTDSVFVFDEPSIGLHPLDVQVLLGVFQTLLDSGATVVVIEHDLDVIHNADYVIDMGPGGGESGGRIVACGTPREIRDNQNSVTGRYL